MNIWQAFVRAAKADDLHAVKELTVTYPELKDNDRALVTSARYGHEDIVSFLVGDEPPVEVLSKALFAVVFPYRAVPKSDRHPPLVTLLLGKINDEYKRSRLARRLVGAATQSGSRSLVDALIEHADQDVYTAAALGDLDTVHEWIKQNRRVVRYGDESGKTPLHYCASSALGRSDERVAQNLVNVAHLLLDWGADIEATCKPEGGSPFGLSPLECAVSHGDNPDLVSVLVNHGARDLENALWALLVHRRDPGAAQFESAGRLLNGGAAIDRPFNDRTILQDLAHHGSEDSLRWVIEHGADVNARTPDARTPLHFAADRDDGDAIVTALVEAGADPKALDEDGHPPLWYADKGERQSIVDQLRSAP